MSANLRGLPCPLPADKRLCAVTMQLTAGRVRGVTKLETAIHKSTHVVLLDDAGGSSWSRWVGAEVDVAPHCRRCLRTYMTLEGAIGARKVQITWHWSLPCGGNWHNGGT